MSRPSAEQEVEDAEHPATGEPEEPPLPDSSDTSTSKGKITQAALRQQKTEALKSQLVADIKSIREGVPTMEACRKIANTWHVKRYSWMPLACSASYLRCSRPGT